MRIVVLHASITHRKIFVNVLRKSDYQEVYAYEDPRQALDGLGEETIDLAIIQKKVITAKTSSKKRRQKHDLLNRSARTIITGYEFTEDEVVELLRATDEILLMPFSAETLMQKIAALQNGGPTYGGDGR